MPAERPRRPRRPARASIRAAAEDAASSAGDAAPAPEPEFDTYEVPDIVENDEFPPFAGGEGTLFDPQRTLGEWLEGLVPAEAQLHFLNAGREFAAGVQVTLDHHTGRRRETEDGHRAHHIDIE